jgi:hypothetical protein
MTVGPHACATLAQVTFTVEADVQLRRTLGLRTRVRRALLDVLEAATEIRKLGGSDVDKDAPLFLKVGESLVTYSIDLENQSLTVWSAEPIRQSRGVA